MLLGFTGVPGGGWRVASYGCPIRGPFGRVSALRSTPTRLLLAALSPRLKDLGGWNSERTVVAVYLRPDEQAQRTALGKLASNGQ